VKIVGTRSLQEGQWNHTECSHAVDLNDIDHVSAAFNPGLVVNLRDYHTLNEYTYRDIAQLIDGSFLSQKIRADELKRVEYVDIDTDGILNFLVPSSKFDTNGIKYQNQVQFVEWDQIGQDEGFNDSVEKARMLLWQGNIKLHCTCPSFIFFGYQYLLSVLDSAIYPEERPPVTRNPRQRGAVCKHLNRVMRVLPFYSGRISSAIKSQFG